MNDSIFSPKYNITPTITSALEDIDRQKWLIDNMLLMPKHEAWLRRDVQVKRSSGTTRIEGASLDEAAVSKLMNNRGLGGKVTEDEQANINALAAYEFIDYLSDQTDIPVDELAIRELNRQFMRGAPETLTPGVYRKGENKVGNFAPPDQGDVPSLMRSFALWLRNDHDEIHPILKAGIAHIHFVAIHPFWDGNGRTARGLTTLLLQRSDFGFRKLLSLESHLYTIRDDYFNAIERTLGVSYISNYDSTRWLEFFTLALNFHIQQLAATMTDWHRRMDRIYKDWENKGWTLEQADAYVFAIQTGQITRSDYMEITGVSSSTASRDLAELAKVGMLIPQGKTRSRTYRPAQSPIQPRSAPEADQLRLPEE